MRRVALWQQVSEAAGVLCLAAAAWLWLGWALALAVLGVALVAIGNVRT